MHKKFVTHNFKLLKIKRHEVVKLALHSKRRKIGRF